MDFGEFVSEMSEVQEADKPESKEISKDALERMEKFMGDDEFEKYFPDDGQDGHELIDKQKLEDQKGCDWESFDLDDFFKNFEQDSEQSSETESKEESDQKIERDTEEAPEQNSEEDSKQSLEKEIGEESNQNSEGEAREDSDQDSEKGTEKDSERNPEKEAEQDKENNSEHDGEKDSDLTEEEINEKQKEAIKDAFKRLARGEKLTREQLGNLGEMMMDQYYISQGYKPLNKHRVTSIDDSKVGCKQGIDGVYEKTNPDGSKSYVISDAKYNTSTQGDTAEGKQMSESWIYDSDRLDKAVGKEKADEIRAAYENDPDSVSHEIYHIAPAEDGTASTDVQNVDSDGNKTGDKAVVEQYDADGNREDMSGESYRG